MNTLLMQPKVLSGLRIKETALLLAGTVLLQFLVHLIPPHNGTPVGAYLLPMFYAPLIAVAFYGLRVGLITGILAPVLNYALLGNPRPELIAGLTLELTIFAVAAWYLMSYKRFNIVSAPLAYILAKVVAATVMIVLPFANTTSITTFFNGLVNAIPGILVLLAVNIVITRLKEKE